MYTITLLRHGESTGNVQGRVQGQSDFPLTGTGFLQARLLADAWHTGGVSFDWVISSPLLRARQTAGVIAEMLCLPVTLEPAWVERDFHFGNTAFASFNYDPDRRQWWLLSFSSIFQFPKEQEGLQDKAG